MSQRLTNVFDLYTPIHICPRPFTDFGFYNGTAQTFNSQHIM